jgi:hypothetical protein
MSSHPAGVVQTRGIGMCTVLFAISRNNLGLSKKIHGWSGVSRFVQNVILFLTSSSSFLYDGCLARCAPEPPMARLAATEAVEEASNLRVGGGGRPDVGEDEAATRQT